MNAKLKPLSAQVVVITGASSGIGLATARLAAKRDAKLVLVARSEGALRHLVEELRGTGGEAIHVVADVAREDDVHRIGQEAEAAFGRVDTWVNNAGIGLYGRLEETPVDDMRKQMETNYWGQVYGSLEAVKLLRRHGGGAIINVGSEVSERGIPLQGSYCATKHAVKGFTEALRMELEWDEAPISVTLVKPGQIDTPFPVNAKNHLSSEPQHVPPVYVPAVVAETILHAAVKPVRDVYAGGGAKGMAMMAHLAPGGIDRPMEKMVIPGTPSGRPPRRPIEQNGLDHPTERLEERGNYEGHVMRTSLYTKAALNPLPTAAALIGTGLALFAARKFLPHLPAKVGGSAGEAIAKALHITLEARAGKEGEIEALIGGILAEVEREPATRPWFGLRRDSATFEIFEAFPDEAGREAHLTGKGAALLMKKSNALLVRPAQIDRLDVLIRKGEAATVIPVSGATKLA
ncbi:SDR family oxidoreductase [Sphingomonas bacterium]|uniref:SDR family oxidoreductase n=1 Tax=Sphingomonas bacterium TaxID=1895847 RepID=UPI001C2D4248|nr:SDR family oxidoreductase [Sphingomonas bacterium]